MDADCESKLGRFASEMQPVAKLQRSISLLIFELEQATQESKNSWNGLKSETFEAFSKYAARRI